jgi:hypothetical protein
MADEPGDNDPDVLRDHLLLRAERGEITKEQAEAEAAAHRLEPFERRPELPRFDPKLKSHWTIVMAVAWIARRDFELVREQDPEFCSECFHWIYRKEKDRADKTAVPAKRGGYFLETMLAPTVSRLALLDAVSRVRGNVPSTAVMTIREAQAVLWRASSEGRLIAEGVAADGKVVQIPSREWAHLRLFNGGGRETLRYVHSRTEPFTAVKLRQSDLLRLWPATRESPALPATAINKGGRPPEYDWAAIEAFMLEQMRVLGKPHRKNKRLPTKAQLVERTQKEWSDRFDQHPPTSSVRSHLNQLLTKMDES